MRPNALVLVLFLGGCASTPSLRSAGSLQTAGDSCATDADCVVASIPRGPYCCSCSNTVISQAHAREIAASPDACRSEGPRMRVQCECPGPPPPREPACVLHQCADVHEPCGRWTELLRSSCHTSRQVAGGADGFAVEGESCSGAFLRVQIGAKDGNAWPQTCTELGPHARQAYLGWRGQQPDAH